TPIPPRPSPSPTPIPPRPSPSPIAIPTIRYVGLLSQNAYLTVIPSSSQNLPALIRRVRELGVKEGLILPRQAPRGLHVAIGPFGDRNAAERWSNYLRAYGLDARVYFGR
ncbi:MAG: hypothetical protein SFW36_00430, partial [Leptolyngbyaceae cyanobacterium bins.59]|nr:hypothetical protein [Leptolyngbyaceae cyanobacterium bins.59]